MPCAFSVREDVSLCMLMHVSLFVSISVYVAYRHQVTNVVHVHGQSGI